MTKLIKFSVLGRTAGIAFALAILMAAGAFTDAQAQTRVRGGIIVDCPKEKTKKTTLTGGQSEATFRIKGCLCDMEATEPADASDHLQIILDEMTNELYPPDSPETPTDAINVIVAFHSDETSPEQKSKALKSWLRKRGFYNPTVVKVTPPTGGSKSETHYCFDAEQIQLLFNNMLKIPK